MKKLSLILAAVMLLALFVPAMSITSVADDTAVEAQVTDANGTTTQYATVAAAVEAATDGCTITVLVDEVVIDDTLYLCGNGVTFDGGNATFRFFGLPGAALFAVAGGVEKDAEGKNLYYTGTD